VCAGNLSSFQVCDADMVETLVRVLVRDDEDYGKGERE